ncbi:MAG: nickel pincer cofactor biosynthesis protein LarC [Candidatus Bathyarchaeia archaeon]
MSSNRRVAIVDCQIAGVSGDMIVGALLDLGANITKVVEAMKSVKGYMKGCGNVEVIITDVTRRGLHAKKVDVKAEEVPEITGVELIEATVNCIENLKLSDEAKRFASNSIHTLMNAEAKVHGKSVEKVHLHEAGSIDTPAEIIGAAVALEDLNLFNAKVYSTPIAVGGGLFKFSHGIVSSPAPATIEILRSKGFPIFGGPIVSELATPTGASLLVNLVQEAVRFYPLMKPTAIGYGAGTKDFVEMPNVLRITLGEFLDYQLLRDEISVLETNIDDVTGEIIGHTVNRLLQEGAKDVSVIPMFTKKNRPGQILKIIADKTDVERLSRILIEETGTLGVRVYPCERHILSREFIRMDISVGNIEEPVNVKVAKDSKGEIIQIKPEYDDIKRIAEKTGKSLREITELVKMKTKEVLLKR